MLNIPRNISIWLATNTIWEGILPKREHRRRMCIMGDQSKFDMINTRLHFVLKGSHAPSYCSRPTFRHTNSAATQKNGNNKSFIPIFIFIYYKWFIVRGHPGSHQSLSHVSTLAEPFFVLSTVENLSHSFGIWYLSFFFV